MTVAQILALQGAESCLGAYMRAVGPDDENLARVREVREVVSELVRAEGRRQEAARKDQAHAERGCS